MVSAWVFATTHALAIAGTGMKDRDMNYLDQKVIVITGASSGLGAAAARALAVRGVRIIAAAIDGSALDAFVAELRASGVEAVGKVTDVTSLDDTRELAQFAKDTYGSIDILVNNAGLMLFSNWTDIAVNDWNKMIDVNIKGYLNMIAAVLPYMLKNNSGHVLNKIAISPADIGKAVVYALNQPANVTVNDLIISPTQQDW